ncbi:MAG: hypothetical protein ABI372_04940 [Ginsengibacter sp.]
MVQEINLEEEFILPKKKITALNIFWAGIIIYTLAYVIKTNPHFNLKIGELIQFIGLILFLPAGIYLTELKIKNRYLAFIFVIYLIWSVAIISRGIHFNYHSVKEMLIEANFGILIYFAPLILLFPQDFFFFKKLFQAIVTLGIFFLIYNVIYIKDLMARTSDTQDVIEYLTKFLGITCGFILLTYKYHSRKKNLLALGVMLLCLLFSLYNARRGLSLICGSILLFTYFMYLFNSKKVILIIYSSILLITSGAYYASTINNIDNNTLLNYIVERGEEDTRTPVELYFYSDFKTNDWVLGRGINGQYYCPGIDVDPPSDFRSYIETGYLQIILKGGMINLILYLLILIPAFFLGLFYSRNIFAKAGSIWILVSLFSLYPSMVNIFTLNYLLVWISVGICYSQKLRRLSDEQIKEFLLFPELM